MTSRQKALLAADLARAKKAEDIVVLDMRKLSNITDFFVICTASSITRAQSIVDNIEQRLSDKKGFINRIEGYNDGNWIVLDAFDIVAHVFTKDTRSFYNLEGIWGNAPKVRLCQRKKKTSLSRKTSRKK